ncbi:unnamed protein product [Leptidea sinapis]|uniref:Uncharacterized protein n=1 Tax=Leptidea sinapis TaxID=189913 RepID=A0A5E4QP33_9NEOP|nr:unnamed protein product [Leptidea sinapis]
MPKAQAHSRINMPYTQGRRQRSVAKKSTVSMNLYPIPPQPQLPSVRLENFTSRVVVSIPHKMVPHMCGPRCKRTDVLSLYELRTYNPLAKPLLSGWESTCDSSGPTWASTCSTSTPARTAWQSLLSTSA